MSNVYTLKDIKNRGHRLGSAYEQELEKKLRTAIDFNSEITDFNEKLQAENSEYSEREKESQRTYADIGNKISQLNVSSTKLRSRIISERKSHSESQRELEAKYTTEIKSLKSNIKTLKRKVTLAQKASSHDKTTILSLEAKIRELEGMLEDKELELERTNGNLNSKKHEIECMEKEIDVTHKITSREIDALSSAQLNLTEENSRLREIISKKDNEIVDISNPPIPPMNDSSQKLPGWVSDDLRPLVYECGLEDKVMELDKSFARENILEALQELLS